MQKETRKSRFELPDNLRGIAVVTMILIHVFNQYAGPSVQKSTFFPILDFMAGPPAAPVFMALMGYFFYLKNPGWIQSIKRGGILIFSGYLLNALKGFVPIMAAREWFGFSADYFPELYTPYYLVFNVEIWILAGLSFMLMGCLNHISRNPLWIGGSILIVALISPFLWGLGEDLPVIGHIIQPLWGSDPDLVIFPLFPWSVYSLFGMLGAAIQKKQNNKRQTLLTALYTGIILTASGGFLLWMDFDRFFNDYGQQSWGAVIAFCGFILLWGLLILGLQKIYPDSWKTGFLLFCSKNLQGVYFIQWMLAGWLFWIIPYHSLNYPGAFFWFGGITAMTCGLSVVYNRIRNLSTRG